MAKKPRLEELESDAPSTPKPSGSEAIRQAMAKGVTKPAEIVEWVHREYGLTVKVGLVNNVKANLKKSGGSPAPSAPTPSTGSATEGLELVSIVKEMVARYGADAVVQAASIFRK